MLRLTARHMAALLHVLAVCLIALWCAACTSGAANHAQILVSPDGGTHSPTQPVAGTQPGFGAILPPPSALVEPVTEPRAASYTEGDLFRLGKNFDPALPNADVSTPGDNVQFAPAWQAGGGTNGLAYCMYTFAAQGFDRELELNYQFTKEPADWGTIWVGNADWAADTWHWREADPSGRLTTLLTLESFGTDGTVLVVFVCAADGDDPALGWVYMGPPQASAKIQTFIHNGIAPVSITADASASTAGGGEITKYEWDWDGDGTFDEDSGGTPAATHTYDVAGEFEPAVRVTSSLGATAIASTNMAVDGPWLHTWGGGLGDIIEAVDASSTTQDIVACGRTISFTGDNYDALLLLFDRQGSLIWAKTSGGDANDMLEDIYLGEDGYFYVTGWTNVGSGTGWDVLLQKWHVSGDLIWSKRFSSPNNETANALSFHNDAIYVAGTADGNAGEGDLSDILVAKFTADGELEWSRTLSGPPDRMFGDTGYDIAATTPLLQDTEVHVVATTYDSAGFARATYAMLNHSGNLTELRRFEDSGNRNSYAYRIVVQLLPEYRIFVGGNYDGDEALFMEFLAGGTPLAKAFRIGSQFSTQCRGMVRTRSGIVLANRTSEGQSHLLFTDGSGELHGAIEYGESGANEVEFWALTTFPGQGVVAVGDGIAALGTPSAAATVSETSLTGTWETLSYTAQDYSGTMVEYDAGVNEITSGVLDAGAGESDALVLTASEVLE